MLEISQRQNGGLFGVSSHLSFPASFATERAEHWDRVAAIFQRREGWGKYYHRRVRQIYQFLIPPGQRVLEIGCGEGDLLAQVQPALGVGIDFSAAMIRQAQGKYPHLRFLHGDAHDLPLEETFDVIILSDLVNDLWDVQAVFHQLRRLCTPRTRILLNFYSRLWQAPLGLARRLQLAKPMLPQNWLTIEDAANLLYLADFEVIRSWAEVLWPLRTPLIDAVCNRFLVKLWPFRWAALTHFMVARPRPASGVLSRDGSHQAPSTKQQTPNTKHKVSVIVPARNEAGNIAEIFGRLPVMGRETELIFVEGHSQDDTYAAIEREMAMHPQRACQLLRQTGTGKGDAVRLGFAQATGDVLMILDADLTVPPEDLPRFYEALASGKGEFINGVRLVYPMERRAMRCANLAGNKFFCVAFSWLLGQPIKDTLCGTKVLWKRDYEAIAANRDYFGDFDPFGDFDLLFGAAKLNLKIADLPIRYRERTYGTTNIQRWKHGWLLLNMVLYAAGLIKFV